MQSCIYNNCPVSFSLFIFLFVFFFDLGLRDPLVVFEATGGLCVSLQLNRYIDMLVAGIASVQWVQMIRSISEESLPL